MIEIKISLILLVSVFVLGNSEDFIRHNQLFRKTDTPLADFYSHNKAEDCPLTTRAVGNVLQLVAECEEGASFAQFISDTEGEKLLDNQAVRRSISSSVGINLKQLTRGILDENNLNFKQINYDRKTFTFQGSALNTIHFADGNVAISDIKIKNMVFQQGEKEFSKLILNMKGLLEVNGDQLPIELDKKRGKSTFDVKISDAGVVTIEEFAATFKASVENIAMLKSLKKFKIDDIKAISLSSPTIIGKMTIDGIMQVVANSDATDDNLSFGKENLFVVINKKRGENPKIALVFNIAKGKTMDQVFSSMSVKGNYRYSFPLIGKLHSLDWALSLSEGEDIALAAPEPMLLPAGLIARTEMPKDVFETLCKDTSTGIPDFISIELQIKPDGRYLYKMTNGLTPNIEKFLECIAADIKNEIKLPTEVFSAPTKVNITQFFYNPKTSGYDLKMSIAKSVRLFNDALQFTEFDIRIVKERADWSIKAIASKKEVNQEYEILLEIFQTNKAGKIVTAKMKNMNLQEVQLALGFNKDEFQLSNSFVEVSNFGFKELILTLENDGYRISGTLFLFGKNLQLAGIAWKVTEDFNNTSQNDKKKNSNESVSRVTSNQKYLAHSDDIFSLDSTDVDLERKRSDDKAVPTDENQHTKNESSTIRFFSPTFFNSSRSSVQHMASKNNGIEDDYVLNDFSSGMSSLEDHNKSSSVKSANHTDINSNATSFKFEKVNIGTITKGFSRLSNKLLDDGVSENDIEFNDDVTHFVQNKNAEFIAHHTIEDSLNSDSSPLNVNVELSNIFNNLKRSSTHHLTAKAFVQEKRSHQHHKPNKANQHTHQYSHNSSTNNRKSPSFRHLTKRALVTVNPEKYSIVLGMTIIGERLDHLLERLFVTQIITDTWYENMVTVLIFSNTNKDLPQSPQSSQRQSKKSSKRSIIFDALLGRVNKYKRQNVARNYFENTTKQTISFESTSDDWDEKSSITDLPFSPEDLGNIKIKRGLSLSCAMNIPDNCKRSELCKWLKGNLPEDAKIILTGYVSQSKLLLVSKLHLLQSFTEDNGVRIISADLVVSYNENDGNYGSSRVRLDVEFKIPNPVSVKGYLFELSSGKLEVVSTFQRSTLFTFGNSITLGLSNTNFSEMIFHSMVDHNKSILSLVVMDAVITIGSSNGMKAANNIKLNGKYFLNTRDPQSNYLLGDLKDVTLQSLANAFEFNETFPQVASFVMFLAGTKLVYTSNHEGIYVPALGYRIEYGYSVVGNIRVFEFVQQVMCQLSEKRIVCSIQMTPIDILSGLIQIRYSRNSPNNGPVLKIELSAVRNTVALYGYLHALGTSSAVSMDFIDDYAIFNISGTFYNVFLMDIAFKGKMSGQILKTEFKFKGCLKEKDIGLVEKTIGNLLQVVLIDSKTIKTKVETILKSVILGYKQAEKKIESWKVNMEQHLESLRKRVESMKEAKLDLKKSCDEECGNVCVAFFGWNSECFKIWDHWVGCPGWDNCKWKVKDVLCIARCEIEKLGKKVVLWGDSLGIDAIFGSNQMIITIKSSTTQYLRNYKTLVEAAKQLQESYAKISNPFVELDKYVGGGLQNGSLTIYTICVEGFLNKYWKTSSFFTVEGKLFNSSVGVNEDLTIDLNIYQRLAQKLISKRFPAVYSEDNAQESYSGRISSLGQQQTVLEEQKNFIQNKIDDIISGKPYFMKGLEGHGTRTIVSTQEDAFYHSFMSDPVTYDHLNINSMLAYYEESPWRLLGNFHYDMTNIPLFTSNRGEDDSTEVRSMDSCQQMKKVVDKYDKLTQGMKKFADSSEFQRKMYLQTKKMYLKNLDEMKTNINNLETSNNLTVADLEDLLFWYNKVRHGLQEWNARSEVIYLDGQKKGLVAFKNQMDYILKKQKEASIEEYVTSLHNTGIDAYKRSHLPNFSAIKGGLYLGEIKKAILDLYNDANSSPEEFTEKLSSTESRISKLKSFMKSCKQIGFTK